MIQRFRLYLLLPIALSACATVRSVTPPDEVATLRSELERQRRAVLEDHRGDPVDRIRRLTALGLWREADSLIAVTPSSPALELAAAELLIRKHDLHGAQARVDGVLAEDPGNRAGRLLKARLEVEAWRLDAAASIAESLLAESPTDEEAALLIGRIRLLEKRYDEALAWARRVQGWNPESAGAYLLEADVRFWDQDPAGAEPALLRALELDPFNADARFSYGYALWRRVDARLLGAMAAQWELALEVDPLHYVTHWHWGNGHTHLTYADYAHPTDSIVRDRLKAVNARIARGEIAEAIEITRSLDVEFPESVLPAMARASAFYMAYDMDRTTRLDSAQAGFTAILARKPNYGPAHNGLAAVIKQRQFSFLAGFDSLEAAIAATPLPADPAFDSVFKDVRQYPGDRVRKMVRQQLGPSVAYVPLLERLGQNFTLPPLHVDLAEAMDLPWLRTATTFDNRQWMDIRGIGGGSTGIEYVERGSHRERNVLAHEYVHLFHSRVLTDREVRRIRDLYHQAMREGRALDYYAANNEHEFFAQAFEAYFSDVKVHPLNHKAMNTRDDLFRKDPATFAFVDSMVARQHAFLAGDTLVFRSNWAQVYLNLAQRTLRGDARSAEAIDAAARHRIAGALLDTALVWDPAYLPAYLGYAALERDRGRFDEAEAWLARAEAEDPTYAPIHRARAELAGARIAAGDLDPEQGLEEQIAFYRRAIELETDLAVRASLNESLRTLLADHARIAEAIEVAEAYVATAPMLSTYLRDRRDEAAAFANQWRGAIGYAEPAVAFFEELTSRKPQHYDHRKQYAEALAAAGRLDDAVATLEESQRILQAAGNARVDYMVLLAEFQLLRQDTAAAREAVLPILDGRARADGPDPRLARVLAALGAEADAVLRAIEPAAGETPRQRSEAEYTRGWIAESKGDEAEAERRYRASLVANPYHQQARIRLAGLLRRGGDAEALAALLAEAEALPLRIGPDFHRAVRALLEGATR